MRLTILTSVAEQICTHVRREHPREACGLLVGRGSRIEAAVEAANVAGRPEQEFEIDPPELLRCHREARDGGRELLGWYHSHPNGRCEPSATDAARVEDDGMIWLIVADDKLRAFRSLADGPIQGRFEAAEMTVVSKLSG
jgi:proteasome lid subunit RPN8/RPN11